jgi:hypothetical protein
VVAKRAVADDIGIEAFSVHAIVPHNGADYGMTRRPLCAHDLILTLER